MIRHNAVCECGTKTVHHKRWRRLSTDQRATLRAQGYNRAANGSECLTCYSRRRYRENQAAAGKTVRGDTWNSGYTRTELLAEMDHLAPHWRNQPVNVTCRQLAPKLGMKVRTLEQRLRRYGFRSRFGYDGQWRQDAA